MSRNLSLLFIFLNSFFIVFGIVSLLTITNPVTIVIWIIAIVINAISFVLNLTNYLEG